MARKKLDTKAIDEAVETAANDAAETADKTVDEVTETAADATAEVTDAADTAVEETAEPAEHTDDAISSITINNITIDYDDDDEAQPGEKTDDETADAAAEPAADETAEPAAEEVAEAEPADEAPKKKTTRKTATKSAKKSPAKKSTKKTEETKKSDDDTTIGKQTSSIASRIDRVIVNAQNDNVLMKQYPNFACNKVTLAGEKGRVNTLDNVQFACYTGHTYALHVTDDEDSGVTADAKRKALLGIMTGMIQPTSGAVMNKSANIQEIEPLDLRGHRFGIVTQQFAVRPELDAEHNVRYAMDASNRNFLKPKPVLAREMLTKVGFDEVTSGVAVGTLPEVQQRLVAIARAISTEALVLILDEPTHGLNDDESVTVLSVLSKLAHKTNPKHCVIFLTESEEIAQSADQIIEI